MASRMAGPTLAWSFSSSSLFMSCAWSSSIRSSSPGEVGRQRFVFGRPGVDRLADKVSRRLTEVGDKSVDSFGPRLAEVLQLHQLRDVVGQVTHPFQVVDDAQDRDDQPQIPGDGRLLGKKSERPLLDVQEHPVDLVVSFPHFLGERPVALDQRPRRVLGAPLDDRAHGHDLLIDSLQFLVKRLSHRSDLPVPARLSKAARHIVFRPFVARLGEDLAGLAELHQDPPARGCRLVHLGVEKGGLIRDPRGLLHVVSHDDD